MSTVYSLVNDEGRVGKTSRICFGSMAALENIRFDTVTPSVGMKQGAFEAPRVNKVIFHGAESDHGEEFDKYVKQLAPLVTHALKSPFFKEGHFSWDEETSELTVETNKDISIEQVMLGLFAIRNLYDYPSVRRSFLTMVEEGIQSDEAIILANVFCASMTFAGAGSSYTFYTLDGDGAVMPYDARVADIVGLMRTGLTKSNQGQWGDHECGYLSPDYDDDEYEFDYLIEASRVGCKGMDGFLSTEIWRDTVINRSMSKDDFINQMKRIAAYV